jgi:hypothetical protein
VRLDRIAAVLTPGPDRLQVSLATIRWFDEAAVYEPSGIFRGCAWRSPAERLRHYIRKLSPFCLTDISAFTRFTRFTRFPLTCFDFFSQLVLQPRALEQDRANCVNRVNCVNLAPAQFPSPASREMPM